MTNHTHQTPNLTTQIILAACWYRFVGPAVFTMAGAFNTAGIVSYCAGALSFVLTRITGIPSLDLYTMSWLQMALVMGFGGAANAFGDVVDDEGLLDFLKQCRHKPLRMLAQTITFLTFSVTALTFLLMQVCTVDGTRLEALGGDAVRPLIVAQAIISAMYTHCWVVRGKIGPSLDPTRPTKVGETVVCTPCMIPFFAFIGKNLATEGATFLLPFLGASIGMFLYRRFHDSPSCQAILRNDPNGFISQINHFLTKSGAFRTLPAVLLALISVPYWIVLQGAIVVSSDVFFHNVVKHVLMERTNSSIVKKSPGRKTDGSLVLAFFRSSQLC